MNGEPTERDQERQAEWDHFHQEPTVLDVLDSWEVFTASDDLPGIRAKTGIELVAALGIPADFPAADLPKAIAMWQRAQDLTVHKGGSVIRRLPTPVNIGGVWFDYETTRARSLLAYLRGES